MYCTGLTPPCAYLNESTEERLVQRPLVLLLHLRIMATISQTYVFEGKDMVQQGFWAMLKWAATWQNQENGCAPSEDSDQPGHPPSLIRQPGHPPSLIRVFAVRTKKAWVLSYPLSAQRRLWSDWADAQADLSLRWAHRHFVGFAAQIMMFTS